MWVKLVLLNTFLFPSLYNLGLSISIKDWMQMAILGYGTDHKNPENAVGARKDLLKATFSPENSVLYKTTSHTN